MYLEDAMEQPGAGMSQPIKWLSEDFMKLKELFEEVNTEYNSKVNLLFTEAKLKELYLKNDLLENF